MTIDFKKERYILDGAMGTMLQQAGMQPGEDQNEYLLTHPEVVRSIHRRYAEAGSDIIYAPTFTVNRARVEELDRRGGNLEEDIRRLLEPGLQVKAEYMDEEDGRPIYVALDLGPLGQMLEPMGDLSFEDAYDTYRRLAAAGAKAGADLAVIETMTDLYEVRAAVLAVKEHTDLPVMVSMSFDESGRTFTGTSLEAMAVCLTGLGVDAMGINCSLGPEQILPMIREMMEYTDIPVFAKPNAGLPDPATGTYDITASQFAEAMGPFIEEGVNMVGGCCGTDPDYIRGLAEKMDACRTEGAPQRMPSGEKAPVLKLSSRSRVVTVDQVTVIGERLNPTGKKKMKQALLESDFDYILGQAIDQIEAGARILDVNVGVPGLDEAAMMPRVIKQIQSITDLPLQIDSSDPAAIDAALRVYNGKPIVNSVNGEDEVLDKILPLVKKYGAAVIGLTLNGEGIPATAEERFAIAEKILDRALEYGIPREDVIIDCLTLTASAQQKEVDETLKSVRMVKEKLGLKTALGVSNVSFGLPLRPVINRTFLIMAMENGLDLPIINPNDEDMMASVFAFNVLKNVDQTAEAFIGRYAGMKAIRSIVDEDTASAMTAGKRTGKPGGSGGASGAPGASGASGMPGTPGASSSMGASGASGASGSAAPNGAGGEEIFAAIENGMAGQTAEAVERLLLTEDGMDVVNKWMIPALDRVGQQFETGVLFLPQMLQSATAAQAGFEVIRQHMAGSGAEVNLGDVVIATVHGDIHDIGKNIVKVIMDNYGFHMIDLGKDVPADQVVDAVRQHDIRLVGLSALMTTTLKSMEETIAAVKAASPQCKVMVGGAVLTEDYAMSIGADYYCKDAMKSVEAAQDVFGVC